MTNNNFDGNVDIMFAARWVNHFKKEKRVRAKTKDVVSEQVKKILQATDQRLILMVRN